MKKTVLIVLTVMLCYIMLCSCSNKALTSDSWVNVNDGDIYVFNDDGTGTHDDNKITYTIEDGVVTITEGADSVSYTLIEDSEPKKMTTENDDIYYVPSQDYESIGKAIRDKNIDILKSFEFWQSVSNNTVKMQFSGEGNGYYLKVGNTLAMTWEMVDNNTVSTKVSINDNDTISILDIVEENGEYTMRNEDGEIIWKAKD